MVGYLNGEAPLVICLPAFVRVLRLEFAIQFISSVFVQSFFFLSIVKKWPVSERRWEY